MIPSVEEVEVAHAYLQRRFQYRTPLNKVGLILALRFAEMLSETEQDEPAALFNSLVLFPLSLGDSWRALPTLVVSGLARNQGYSLRFSPSDLEQLYEPILKNVLEYEDVRAWFARRLEKL